MNSFAVAVVLAACSLAQPQTQDAVQRPKATLDWFSDFSFEKLPQVIQWIGRLDREWENLVQREERAQVLRRVKDIASATAELEIGCVTTASLLRTGVDTDNEIGSLEHAVEQLRSRMTALSVVLGGQIGKDGEEIAEQFNNFMVCRASKLSMARQRLKANQPDDRAMAAAYLMEAANLAREAREALVLFIRERAAQE